MKTERISLSTDQEKPLGAGRAIGTKVLIQLEDKTSGVVLIGQDAKANAIGIKLDADMPNISLSHSDSAGSITCWCAAGSVELLVTKLDAIASL
ncbi:hypothetical protein P4E94_15710 [Pontiellaceae bacterium B12219]|nr:hypothetical protein [Pontiellaceae bacterium B12219]